MPDSLDSLDRNALERLLFGFETEIIHRAVEGGAECAIRFGLETFTGRGDSAEAALRAAVKSAFPTSLARAALLSANAPRALPRRPSTASAPGPNDVIVAYRSPRGSFTPMGGEGVERFRDAERSLEVLEILKERIRDSREELGLCSAERQRLAILAWISEARAHGERFSDDDRVRERVTAISRLLTEIGKSFWPGSVNALQLQTQPKDLPKAMLGAVAGSWAAASDLAEQALRDREQEDDRRGRDAQGWADRPETHPAPSSAAEEFGTLLEEVERTTGPLVAGAMIDDQARWPDAETYRRWVRTLRWLRTAEVDPDLWARLAGRFRWWASRRESELALVGKELQSGYAPRETWARVLGREDSSSSFTARVEGPALASARRSAEGRRIMLVGHRRDPALQDELQTLLGTETIEVRIAEPKRLSALREELRDRGLDFLLGAIGFQAQSVDVLLAELCRDAGIRYLRVGNGRPGACIRALGRVA